MACNTCENGFQNVQSLRVSVTWGPTANLYLQNQGRNILLVRRILLCYRTTWGGTGTLYLRPPPDGISWIYPSTYIEPGLTALYYQLNTANVTMVQAQAEYTEIDGRSRSCVAP